MTRVVTKIEMPHSLRGTEPVGLYKDIDSLREMYKESPGAVVTSDTGIVDELFHNQEGASCLAAYEKDADGRHLQGFAQYVLDADIAYGSIDNLFVDEDARRKGAGGALIQRVLKEAREQGIETVNAYATKSAISLYEKQGFVVHPDEKLDPEEDTVHMIATISHT
jgi:GNAT superfamily N-acetyltransferase